MLTEREVFISLVDNDLVQKSDAIILLEGDGLSRYQYAIDLYKQGLAPVMVFSGGITNYGYGSYPFKDIKPMLLKSVPEDAVIHESKSLHTQEQSVEILKLCKKNNWNRIILVASHYHQYRAYLTFLKEVLNDDSNMIIFNAPARQLKWFENTDWGSRFENLYSEFERIDKYSKLGHLATYKQAIEYQKWKEEQWN